MNDRKQNKHMTSIMIRYIALFTFLNVGVAWMTASTQAQNIFSDSFDTDTSGDWIILDGSDNSTPDYEVIFARDYSQDMYSATVDGAQQLIPVPKNPFSEGETTLGLKMAVNIDEFASAASVAVFPLAVESIEGNFSMQFEMFLSYNGGAYGGTGSTELSVYGINASGERPIHISSNLAIDGDGVFFAATGEAGASRDYRAYTGDGISEPLFLDEATESVGFIDRDGDFFGDYNNLPGSALEYVFPASRFQTPGSPGKNWVRMEIRRVDGVVTWLMDGHIMAEIQAEKILKQDGRVFLGYSDPFSSIASPGAENYVIYDNLRILPYEAPGKPIVGIEGPGTMEFNPDLGMEVFVPATISEDGGSVEFSITRTGDTAESLIVKLATAGTAVAGVDYSIPDPMEVIIPAGSSSSTLTLEIVNDTTGEQQETIVLFITSSEVYEVREKIKAEVKLNDDGDLPFASAAATRPGAYESDPANFGQFRVSLSSEAITETTIAFEISGGAAAGTDYEAVESSVIIPEGETGVTIDILPIDNTNLDGDRTVTLTIVSGTGYKLSENVQAVVTIRDDEKVAGESLFQESFSTDVSADWIVLFDALNGVEDFSAEFNYDYSAVSIPSAPNTTDDSTTGLRLAVNKLDAEASAAAVNVFPRNLNLEGNYSVRYDMYISVDLNAAGTTEHSMMGLNHSGEKVLRHSLLGGDGTWFVINSDGSNNRVMALYKPQGEGLAPNITAYTPDVFGAFFPSPPNLAANAPVGRWVVCEMRQVGSELMLFVDGVMLFTTTGGGSGKPMFGHNDQFNSVGSVSNFTLIDNIQVVRLEGPAPAPSISAVALGDGVLTLTIAGNGAAMSAIQFESSTLVGPEASWSPVSGVTITEGTAGNFSAQIPIPAADTLFVRLAQ